MTDARVADLLSVWRRRSAAGDPVSPEELCRDAPELLDTLRRQIEAARATPPAETTPHQQGTAAGGTVSDGRTPAFGPYVVVRELGSGGMGRVLEAHDPALGRRVAVKEIRPELAADPGARDRFLREARAAAAVRHDHIVPVYHVGERDGAPFLVMPLLAGESLAARLDRGPLPPGDVARVGREAASGLAAAHAAGLVHRDVKPANLWLEDPDGRVLILDFGLARATDGGDALTRPGSVLGTPGYLAPEQANGLPVDGRADLFSLGATLYHAATGVRPFRGPTLTATLRAVGEHHPPPPREVNPAVPAALSDLIVRLLAKSPADRPASAAAVAAELEGRPGTVTFATRAAVPHGGPPRKRRAWVVGGVAGALALVAARVLLGPAGRNDATTPTPADPPPALAPPSVSPVSAPKYRGSIDLLVIRENLDQLPVPVPLSDPRALPLRPGDHFKVVAEVDPPAYLYLFWIDETGAATPMYPWTGFQWGTRPPGEQKHGRLDLKDPRGNWFKISGDAAGMETLVLLARPEPLAAPEAEVRGWFDRLRPLRFAGPKARQWFEGFEPVAGDPDRAPDFGDGPGETGGPLGLQSVLKQRIGAAAGFARAVSFARLGKPESK
ncbi:protein kinase domain-containing protein [Gemmata sp.]|uniref:serine/threonine protein kinase n=1 Tax=Gemmata sp. TaxID=1914242 RepID=UPI003F70DD52